MKDLLAYIEAEIAALQKAKVLLIGYTPSASGRRTMSAEARARIAAAQRKRWAKQKAKR